MLDLTVFIQPVSLNIDMYMYFLLTNPCIPCDTKENREGDTLNECMDCL